MGDSSVTTLVNLGSTAPHMACWRKIKYQPDWLGGSYLCPQRALHHGLAQWGLRSVRDRWAAPSQSQSAAQPFMPARPMSNGQAARVIPARSVLARSMDLLSTLPAFVLAVVVISATPGPAFALIVQRTASRGRRSGLATIVGLEIGLYTWALLVASGMAVVAASEAGFVALKVIGCIVLAWLAAKSFRAWWRLRSASMPGSAGVANQVPLPGPRRRDLLWAVGEGFVVQMANPKAAIFLLALYPQFVPAERPLFQTTAFLGLVQVAIETLLYMTLALGVHRASAWFRRSTVRRRLQAVTGTVMVVLGVRLAAAQR